MKNASILIPPFSFVEYIRELKNAVRCGFGAQSAGPSPYCASLNVLSILAEFGDFNPVEHDEAFVSEFRFHPKQDEHMEMSILG